MNNCLKLVLKFVFSTGLLAWLVSSGRLDFGLVKRALMGNPWWPLALVMILLASFLSSISWRALLHSHSKKRLPLFDVFKITWIGMFFNTFLPGSVSGDLVKLLYAKDLGSSLSKKFLVFFAFFLSSVIQFGGVLVFWLLTFPFYEADQRSPS